MRNDEFVELVRQRIVQVSVGPSAMRGQGKGVVAAVRDGLDKVDLKRFSVRSARRFSAVLDEETKKLMGRLPLGSRKNWGTARKALNLFLRDCLYSGVVAEHYGFKRLSPWFELPMDSFSAEGIKRSAIGYGVPKWKGVKHLTPEDSVVYQEAANAVAAVAGIERVHLDLLFFRQSEK